MAKIKKAEAAGLSIIIFLLVYTLAESRITNPDMFLNELFYLSLGGFLLVTFIFVTDKVDFKTIRINTNVVLATISGSALVFGLVSMDIIRAQAAIMSFLPTTHMTLHQLLFVGAFEGILHFTFLHLGKIATGVDDVTRPSRNKYLVAIIFTSAILMVGLHTPSLGLSPSLLYLFILFSLLSVVAMLPRALSENKKKLAVFSLIVLIVPHAFNNLLIPIFGTIVPIVI